MHRKSRQHSGCLLPFIPLQRFCDLVINKLIGVIAIVRKNVYSASLKMLKDRRGAGGAAALSVVALTDNIKTVLL